jgi:PKD repeat protein
LSLLMSSMKVGATTCADATVIDPANLPNAQALVCGTSNDVTSSNTATCGNGSYRGGLEALYVFTPTTSGPWNISYSGQTWSGIFVYAGCPTSGGTCVANITSSTASKNLNATLTAGVTYYIMFDTWPTPASPCAGTFTITAPPTCFVPTNLSVSNVLQTTARINYGVNANNTGSVTYEYEIRSSGAAGSGATGLEQTGTSTGLFANLSGLVGGVSYNAYVRTVCGGTNGNSAWSSAVPFTTLCAPLAAPFVEGFESSTTAASPCWTQQSTVGTRVWTFATGDGASGITTAHGGTKNARYVSSSTPSATILVSPMVDITTLANPRVEFWYGQVVDFGDQNELKVYYRTHPLAQWVLLAHYPNEAAAWTVARLPIPGTAISPTFQIGFEGINGWGKSNVLDDVRIEETPSCYSPELSDLTFASITDVSAIANWLTNPAGAPGDYEIEVRETGTTQGSQLGLVLHDTVSSSVLSQALTGLTGNTNYTFYIRALCATSQGLWISKDFRTLCSPQTLPFVETFDTWNPTNVSSSAAALTSFDLCWSYDKTPSTSSYGWYTEIDATSSTGTGPTGPAVTGSTKYIYLEASNGSNGNQATLTLPALTINGYAKLSVYLNAHSTSGTLDGKLYFEREVSGVWVKLDSVTTPQGQAWKLWEVGFNGLGLEKLRMRGVKGASFFGDIALDELSIVSDPCPAPSAVTLDTATSHTAVVSWTSAPPATGSAVVWGPAGFQPGTGANGGTWMYPVTSPYTITGLMALTSYDVYVLDSCGGGLGSPTGPVNFTTLLPERDLVLHAIYNDLGNCGDSSSAIIVAVRNQGLLPASGYTVDLDVTDPNTGSVIPLTASSTAVVAPGAIDSVVLGTFNSILGGSFGLSASVTSNRDTVSSNDSLAINYSYLPYTPALLPVRTFCSNAGMVYVAAQPYPGTVIRWFSDPAGTQFVGEGDSIMVDVNGPNTYYASYVPKPIVSVGSGSLSTTTSGLTPFSSFYEDSRSRVMILASELTALGLSAGNITDLAIEVTSLGGQPIENFNIQMWDTNSTSVGNLNDPAPSSAHVFYTDTLLAPVVGKNTFSGTPFYWNGQDNLVIQFCHDADNWVSPNYGVAYSVASFQASTYAVTDGVVGCTHTYSFPATSANRINIDITIPAAPCVNAVPAAVSFVKDTINVADAQFTSTWLNSFQYQFDGSASFADQYTWDFGDGYTNSTTLTPIHTFATSGTYDVTLTVYEAACGSWDTLTQEVSYFIGTDELGISAAAFPNPTTGVVNIVANNMGEFTGVLKVYNVLGQLITESNVSAANGDLNHKLDLSGLAKGLYTIVLTNEDKTANLRVVLQ